MDSSSSSSLPAFLQTKYDVFLSFRGQDTRDTFTSHLHAALRRKNIDTYIDNRLKTGDEIAPTLLEAIEKSKLALVIFSKAYASSTWCLKELVHILGCKKSHGQIVIPIFYRTDPSHVRKQQGTYAPEDRPLKRSRDEVANWRAALEEAANMSGFHYSRKTWRTEADFVEKVVQDVLTKLNRESSSDLRGLFGIQRKIEKIESLLCLETPGVCCVGVCCVGIWGMGGIGKTTLADAVFHRHSSKFEVCCFLANVRENSEQTNGLHQLRNKLVGEILKEKDVNIDTPSIPPDIQVRLGRPKALIVLDDVNARKQLEYLVGDHDRFCQGSRIIITARDKGLLEQKVDPAKIFSVEGLGPEEALELFHSHAFGNKFPTTDYTELSREVVDYIKGIPLALKVMGSSFRRCKSKQEWEVQWKKVKRVPIGEIQKVLRVSYDGLDDNEKEIFLDIACFYKGYLRKDLERILDSCDCFGEVGINDLIDRSLISISQDTEFKKVREAYSGRIVEMQSVERIEMHDLVQEMGRAIARNQGSRLFNADDVYEALTNNQPRLKDANFQNMYQLRWLRVSSYSYLLSGSLHLPNSLRYLYWDEYPLESLPSKFSAQNLLVLDMPCSKFGGQLWNEDQSPVNVKRIDLHFCPYLTEVPNLSQCLNIEHINLEGCGSLVEIPSYFQHLGKLTYLHLGRCGNLKSLPEMPCNLEILKLSRTAIEELPSSVWSHEKISRLDIEYCKHLKSLPSSTCTMVKEVPPSIGNLVALRKLNLAKTEIKSIPASIKQAAQLSHLCLNGCKSLEYLPELPPLLQCLEAHGCTRLDENARSNIMGDAQLRIMRIATASSKFKEDEIEESFRKRSFVAIRCCGNEIPKWFSHKSEGCSIKIELPRDWFSTDFLGFALSLVVDFAPRDMKVGFAPWDITTVRCKYNFKTSNGESHEVKHPLCNLFTTDNMLRSEEDSHGVFVWWYNNVFEEVLKGAESPTAFYKLVTEVNVHFKLSNLQVEVKKCGICLLYGKDAEMIKQRAL
ncbi:hypothetical protein L3X38_044358 [Prunus dulcis]|uniref:ADP-ribosyl cyclase/cyclic ADP-ribose hydrolase n=1 Tax=Prunus dulcis TaxID=3755 RepID=A0AAD4V0M2_PRUDU|nr:hypothetical protein L3X38_044358 [Prunus dulcis]